MKPQIMRIEIKVDGILVEAHEFVTTNTNDPTGAFWSFIKGFRKCIDGWNFAKFFN